MSLDTKYRPQTFAQVLGQDTTIKILKAVIAKGKGFHQSYLFSGPYGGGKTTVARILARALMCESPKDSEACGACPTCLVFAKGGTAEGFVEMDAATNSGKDNIKRIVEEAEYSTFSGKRRVYLLDEAHALSPQALDGLLKSMEENMPGSQDKKLVCIFCTTEPEKMKATIASRCLPFRIRAVAPELIAAKLAEVCKTEGIAYEPEALTLLASAKESHIRDCYKALETLSPISVESVKEYTGMNHYSAYVQIAISALTNPATLFAEVEKLKAAVPATVMYDRIIDLCLLAYRRHLGPVEVPTHMDKALIEELSRQGDRLLPLVQRLSTRPNKPTHATLLVDLLTVNSVPAPKPNFTEVKSEVKKPEVPIGIIPVIQEEKKVLANGGLTIDPRAVNQNKVAPLPPKDLSVDSTLTAEEFSKILNLTLRESLNGLP